MRGNTGRGTRRRWLATLLAATLVVAACSSTDDDATDPPADDGTDTPDGGDAPEGSTAGLSDGEIRISAIVPDVGPLVEIGLAPDFGDFVQHIQVFVDELNAEGGIGGRQIVYNGHTFQAGSTPTEQQASCIAATEDDDAFAVVFTGGSADETALCVTEQHERIALMMAGALPASVFERSEGRLFTNSISIPRLVRIMVEQFDEAGELEGRTLGLVRADDTRNEEIADVLRAELAERGYEFAAESALPCTGNACQQVDVGVQRLMGADVDAVFSLLGPVAYPSFVGEAENQNWSPQWFASDIENQVTQTTAGFFEGAAGTYDGALGITVALEDDEPDDFRQGCNDRMAEVTGEAAEFGTDRWRAVGNACETVFRIARVVDAIEDDGLPLNHATFIDYMERENVDHGARRGAFGPDKHDAYDALEFQRFSAACVCWEPVPDSRILDQ